MKKQRKIGKWIIIAVVAVAVIAGGFFWVNFQKNKFASLGQAAANNVATVTVISITKQKIQPFAELPGRVNAVKISEVRPQADGMIKKIKFIEGSLVKQGQPLYEIDPVTYKAAYESAVLNLKALSAKYNRYQALLTQDAVSKQEFDDVSAALAQAKFDAKKAKKGLDYTKVLAPISGYIGKSNFTEGTLVTANQTAILTTITQLDPIYVDIEQPAADAIAFDHNNKESLVNLVTDDPTYHNIGKLKFSEMFADASTDSVRLRAIFSNKDKKLLPGMFVSARLNLKPFEAIIVPQRATMRGPNGNLGVFVVNADNMVKIRQIKAERIYQDYWIVDEGLQEGDVIVYEGFIRILDGSKVNPVPLVTEEKKEETK